MVRHFNKFSFCTCFNDNQSDNKVIDSLNRIYMIEYYIL